jgi:hypothetical protein
MPYACCWYAVRCAAVVETIGFDCDAAAGVTTFGVAGFAAVALRAPAEACETGVPARDSAVKVVARFALPVGFVAS